MWPDTFCLVSIDITTRSLRNPASGVANLSQTRAGVGWQYGTPFANPLPAHPSQGLEVDGCSVVGGGDFLVSPAATSGGARSLAGAVQWSPGTCLRLCR